MSSVLLTSMLSPAQKVHSWLTAMEMNRDNRTLILIKVTGLRL